MKAENCCCLRATVQQDKDIVQFRPLDAAGIEAIRRAVALTRWRTCDFSVGGIALWADWFNYEYATLADGTVLIKGLDERDRRREAFAIPFGEHLAPGIEALRAYCRAHRMDSLLLSAVPEAALESLAMTGAVSMEKLDDWADYIYDIEALATLRGKHLNKKRNHVNRFAADNPGYTLEKMNAANAADCAAAFAGWPRQEKADEAMAAFDREQTLRVLGHFDAYGFEGAVLRLPDGTVAAVTCAETVADTLIVHIEKMDHRIAGSGESINCLFAQMMRAAHPELLYINREDDSGDPGLRRAKESYHPVMLLEKYNVWLRP